MFCECYIYPSDKKFRVKNKEGKKITEWLFLTKFIEIFSLFILEFKVYHMKRKKTLLGSETLKIIQSVSLTEILAREI